MAAARRLSELLQEQQEPFLLEAAAFRTRRPRRASRPGAACCTPPAAAACRRLLSLCTHGFKKRRAAGVGGGLRAALSKVLCGSRAVRRALRWEDLCFSGAGGCGGREFRRLRRYSGECDPRAVEFAWKVDDDESSRQLSPVSVLDRRSHHDGDGDDDDSSPVHHSPWEDDDKPSTSGSSPPSDAFLGPASPCFTYTLTDKFCAMDVDDEDEDMATGGRGKSIEEQISSWERIAGDIARIPAMMELDLRQSTPQWRERRPEVAEVGARIETLIFDDMRAEAVCDMLASRCTLATSC